MADMQTQQARAGLAAMLEGRSDEEITKGIEAQGVETVLHQVFTGMQAVFVPERAGGQSAVVQYDITAAGTVYPFQVKIAGGKCEIANSVREPARVTLALGVVDFLRLITGKLNGIEAFMTGKLKLQGDMMFAQVMQGWFLPPQ